MCTYIWRGQGHIKTQGEEGRDTLKPQEGRDGTLPNPGRGRDGTPWLWGGTLWASGGHFGGQNVPKRDTSEGPNPNPQP